MAKIKLNKIIGMFLEEIDGGKAEYAKAYQLAVRANNQMKWDITGKKTETCLEVGEDLIVHIPDYFTKVTKVGIPDTYSGKIAALTENNSISKAVVPTQRRIPFPTNTSSVQEDFLGFPVESYGKGGYSNIGEYRIDEEENIIILPPDFPFPTIIVEGIDTRDADGDVCVNVLLTEAIIAFMNWKWNRHRKGIGRGDKIDFKEEYYNEKANAKFRIKKPKLQDLNRMARQSDKFLKS